MTHEKFEALRGQWNKIPADVVSGRDTSPAAQRGMEQAAAAEAEGFMAFASAFSQTKAQTGGGGR